MYVVGLTGGIGSGKSTVARMLAARGAVVIDADAIAREVVEPGTDGFKEIVEVFGRQVVAPDGTLDRAALGAIVFGDTEKRRVLESITHPRIGQQIARRLAKLADSGAVVVLDVPLLVESGTQTASLAQTVVVVASSVETQLAHLAAKGMSESDARARIAAQAPLEDKLAIADHVVWNDGTLDELEARVDEVWRLVKASAA